MARKLAVALLASTVLALAGSQAAATSLTGDFAIVVTLPWTDRYGPGWGPLAPWIDFAQREPVTRHSGTFVLLAGSGDFAGLGPTGTIGGFTYSGSSDWNSPGPPNLRFEFPDGLTFDLLQITSFVGDTGSLGAHTISGIGVFHREGFDDTVSEFSFSGQTVWRLQGTFAFSTPTVAVPEPDTMILLGTMILFGSGLLGLSVIAWKRGRSRKSPTARA